MTKNETGPVAGTAAVCKTDFSAILERVVAQTVRKETPPPVISDQAIEYYAKLMASFGYEFTADTLNILSDYLKGYNLWLCGNVGTGKTFFFDCMSKVRRKKNIYGLVKLSMIETQGWTMENARNWADETREDDVVIDDVGTEPLMKSYGQEAEVFPYLLEKRMQLSSKRTHLTSNLGILDIKKRYGERVADRFVQVFKMEQMDKMKAKKSRRTLQVWRKVSSGGMEL